MSIADKLITIAENEAKVYEAGKQAEYDAFWDAYQDNGKAWSYNGAFAGVRWTIGAFKPKYDIKGFTSAQNLFWANTMTVDLQMLLDNLGRSLDFSSCKSITGAFTYSNFIRIGVLDFRNVTSASTVFSNSTIITIDKIIVSANTPFNQWFASCDALENVIFEGEIAKNGLNLQDSTKLSKASITSIINALSSTTTGLTVTLSQTAVNNAFTDDEWAALKATKSNWTITLL